MLFLKWRDPSIGSGPRAPLRAAALFGAGLIGRPVAFAIKSQANAEIVSIDFDWAIPDQQAAQCAAIKEFALSLARLGDGPLRSLAFIWSAGVCGFGSRADQLEPEFSAFERVVSLAQDLAKCIAGVDFSFHHVSSAGGLYEGQIAVTRATGPVPLRPYAEAKIRQEARVEQLAADMATHIYRPSTVYGFLPHARLGLVSTLLRNALRRRTTLVYARSETLRDFVHNDDVGAFIADRVLAPGGAPGAHILASGKPTATGEVIDIVHRLVDQPLYVQFDPNPSNALDTTFVRSALPVDFFPRPLATGVRNTASALMQADFARGA